MELSDGQCCIIGRQKTQAVPARAGFALTNFAAGALFFLASPASSGERSMWSSKLFRNFFAAFSLLIALSLLLFSVLVARSHEYELRGELRRELRIASAMLVELAVDRLPNPETDREQLQRQIQLLGQQTLVRLTIITVDGEVVADSDRDSAASVGRMGNHLHRPEVHAALRTGDGFASRYSTTLKEDMYYDARRVGTAEAPLGVVRSSIPQRSIRRQVKIGRSLVGLFAGTVMLAGLAGTRHLLGKIIDPLLKINEAVNRMASGRLGEYVEIPNRDELGTLAKSFNALNDDLGNRIAQVAQRGDQLAAVLRGMVEGVVAVDRDSQVLFANDAAGKLFDFQPETAQGRSLVSLIRDDHLHQSIGESLATRNIVTTELRRNFPVPETLAVHATPLPGEPCPGVVIVLYDMTRIRRLETLRQEFVANVSHELKTPLSSIKAYAETLREGAINDSNNNLVFVRRIEDQAERLNRLIVDLIRLARIESGSEAFDVEDVDLATAIQSCLDEHRRTAEAKSIHLSAVPAVDDDGGLVVKVDEEALRQILENLVSNAIKYTPEDGNVIVRWKRDGSDALIEVQDTGLGIAPQHHERLFERFYRVDKARSRELGGTGLGLSIVKHLVQFFQGSVGVESEVNAGTTFWVRLPLSQKEPLE